jgi:glutathione synthase/RimK-type ligase-like ATP-grasp enzyme
MKTIYIAGGCKGNTAVKVLKHHLESLGYRVTRDAQDPGGWHATLRWGRSYHGSKPALNANVNAYDKYEAFKLFEAHGISMPQIVTASPEFGPNEWPPIVGPWLARKRHHVKGKDIVVCKTPGEVLRTYYAGTHDFFSVFIPTKTEYRVWVFRNRILAVYEKVYKGKGEYEGYTRNHRFGFKFEKRDDMRDLFALVVPCVEAVNALNIDFGAVDILQGKDGKFYVLEVNSMPHIENFERSSGIRLAAAVSKWAEGL